MKKYIAEFLGTFALVFCGTGAIIINEQTHGVIGHAGIAITFGLIVTAMIYTFGNISGSHLNPAVTLGFSVLKLFKAKDILPYLIAQIAGAFAASFLLKFLFPENMNLGATLPAGSQIQSFILEFILTYFLMLTILFTSQGTEKTQQLAGLIIGGVILLEAMFAGPICGASMNPARSLAPAIVSGQLHSLWLYLLAPVCGSLSATFSYKFLSV
ncbi:MAG TPA: aquaporin [Bacteroidia bacterium]|jgi:aquaporin NIP|nr:aquaporin [Bacteroidia bacterium]